MAFLDGGPPVELGHEALKLFQLDSGYRNLNHGKHDPKIIKSRINRYLVSQSR